MTNLSSIARPYALAAFEIARDKQQMPIWKTFLESAALIAKNPSVKRLLANPEVSSAELSKLFKEVLSTVSDKEQVNFISLLAQNKRLAALPDISDTFNVFYAALEKTSNVRVVTAVETEEKFRQTLISALKKRTKRDVILHSEVDPSILGGAIIHIGDNVIDGSIRGKLTRLLQTMTG